MGYNHGVGVDNVDARRKNVRSEQGSKWVRRLRKLIS